MQAVRRRAFDVPTFVRVHRAITTAIGIATCVLGTHCSSGSSDSQVADGGTGASPPPGSTSSGTSGGGPTSSSNGDTPSSASGNPSSSGGSKCGLYSASVTIAIDGLPPIPPLPDSNGFPHRAYACFSTFVEFQGQAALYVNAFEIKSLPGEALPSITSWALTDAQAKENIAVYPSGPSGVPSFPGPGLQAYAWFDSIYAAAAPECLNLRSTLQAEIGGQGPVYELVSDEGQPGAPDHEYCVTTANLTLHCPAPSNIHWKYH